MIAKGDLRAPVCVDCHGSHDVTRPGEPRARISRTCARCHGKVSAEYVKSVHGTALLEQANPDVAVCTDCHRAHDITDPRTPAVLLTTPQLCGKCHSDEKLMKKYGLSTDVVRTYLADFHGMNATMQRAGGARPQVTALCIDCHGVHDITRVKDPSSPVMKANLLTLCRKCHPSAVANFPAAWMSHYEPSWKRTPLVYSAKVFYAVLIPFMISGLVLQILLHLWRVVVNR
jgi:predicted CXXCH cytochrome family protein